MEQDSQLVSKVLVIDADEVAYGVLKVFCHESHLVGLRANIDNLDDIFESNIDLGAVLISEEPVSADINSFVLAKKINEKRPDLPLFLRRQDSNDLEGVPHSYKNIFSGAYCLHKLDALSNLVQESLFARFYPMQIVRGIQGIGEQSISNALSGVDVISQTPFLVKDNIMGEYNSLIALESSWCRGYMMLHISKGDLHNYLSKTTVPASETPQMASQSFVSALTNDIWGGIKSEFMALGNEMSSSVIRTQVPIFIEPHKRYICFGSDKPQLCYHYYIHDQDRQLGPLRITQKLIFNLDWSPENFEYQEQAVENFIDSGDLELF